MISRILSRRLALPRIAPERAAGADSLPESPLPRTTHAMTSAGWVVDADEQAVRDQVWPRASVIVWLDYEGALVVGSTLWRTLGRMVKSGLGSRSLGKAGQELRQVWQEHKRRRAEYTRLLDERWVRLRSLSDTRDWLRDVAR